MCIQTSVVCAGAAFNDAVTIEPIGFGIVCRMTNDIPLANNPYPLPNQTRTGFLKNHITRPNILVGDYTYYDDPAGMQEFEANVLYHFDFIGDRLIIGKFCSIATGVKFIMNGGNHRTDWLTNYPFPIFGGAWTAATPEAWPNKGDTIIGNDVWIGHGATLMPGVQVGDGAIIAAQAVVTSNVDPYAVVGGNPARLLRTRFDAPTVNQLLQLRWWDWHIERITQRVKETCSADVAALAR
jgi:virginiamycin A acetyltransferase